eukprot:968564-Amphidinium_carterae.1
MTGGDGPANGGPQDTWSITDGTGLGKWRQEGNHQVLDLDPAHIAEYPNNCFGADYTAVGLRCVESFPMPGNVFWQIQDKT